MTSDRIIRRPEVLRLLGICESTLSRRIKAGDFPSPIKLGAGPKTRAVGWLESTVNAYLAKLGGEA